MLIAQWKKIMILYKRKHWMYGWKKKENGILLIESNDNTATTRRTLTTRKQQLNRETNNGTIVFECKSALIKGK